MVLGLAVFGTARPASARGGAGGGEGPNPLAKPAGAAHALQVQVIGQQWLWTFRYPGYGGVETTDARRCRSDREVEFHVTSLDVVHSFWAIELGVKADAVPGADNVAYVKALQHRQLPGPLRRAVRPLARPHEHHRTGRHRRGVRDAGSQRAAAPVRRRDQGSCRRTRCVYYPQPLRNAG